MLDSRKRLTDDQTTGGNAHSGTAGAVDGGSVNSGDNGGMPTLLNMESNNAGDGGGSTSGCTAGGKGASGGNASSGDSGTAKGGEVDGSGGMVNMYSSKAPSVWFDVLPHSSLHQTTREQLGNHRPDVQKLETPPVQESTRMAKKPLLLRKPPPAYFVHTLRLLLPHRQFIRTYQV